MCFTYNCANVWGTNRDVIGKRDWGAWGGLRGLRV